MKNVMVIQGTVTNLQRVDTSHMGNPRYSFDIDAYTVYTGVDAMIGYGISKFEGCMVEITAGDHRGKFTLDTIKKV